MLGQQSLALAKEIRSEFVDLTDNLARKTREKIFFKKEFLTEKSEEISPLTNIEIMHVKYLKWSGVKGETISFIDGGVGETKIMNRIPLIIRAGIFKVITGERDLSEREKFEIYPILVGDLESGRKDRGDYSSVIRIVIELLSAFKATFSKDYSNTNLLMLHGPVSYRLSAYTEHYISEEDIQYILGNKGIDFESDVENINADKLITNFRSFCDNCELNINNGGFCDPTLLKSNIRVICFIWYLLKTIFKETYIRDNFEITGVVERSQSTDFIRDHLFPKLLKLDSSLLEDYKIEKTEKLEKDIDSLLEKSLYHDSLILSLLLEEGEYTSPVYANRRYSGISKDELKGLSELLFETIPLKYVYLKIKHNSLPIRIEFPANISDLSIEFIVNRVYMYSRLLPTYAFPVGLDIVDKYAKVPNWLMDSFRKLILLKLGEESIKNSRIEEVQELLTNVFLLQRRDALDRPKAR